MPSMLGAITVVFDSELPPLEPESLSSFEHERNPTPTTKAKRADNKIKIFFIKFPLKFSIREI